MILLFSSELGGTLQKQFKPPQCLKFIHPLWIRFWKIWGKGVPPMPLHVICEISSLVWFCIYMTVYQPELFIISESGSVFNTRDWGERCSSSVIWSQWKHWQHLMTVHTRSHSVTMKQCWSYPREQWWSECVVYTGLHRSSDTGHSSPVSVRQCCGHNHHHCSAAVITLQCCCSK